MEVIFKMLYPAAKIPEESYFSLIKIQNNKFTKDQVKKFIGGDTNE